MSLILSQIITGFANAGILFLAACGLSLIFGVTRIVNLAHGSFYMLGAFFGYTLVSLMSGAFGFWLAVLLAALTVGLIGLFVEVFVLRFVYKAPELFQLAATFGVVLVIQDLAKLIWGPEDRLGPKAPGLDHVIEIGSQAVPAYDIALIIGTPFVAVALWYFITQTRLGTLIRAATQDREMVGALGVNQRWLFTGVFFLGSALAGLGGALQLPKGGADLLMDFNILATIFVVIVVGGMGSLPGAYLASVIISVIGVFGVTYMPSATLVLTFLIMIAVLMVKPYGLLGRPEKAGEHGEVGLPEEPIREMALFGRIVLACGLALLAAFPLFAGNFMVVLVTDVIIFCLFAASLHFIVGLGGLVSFGHAAFYGGGAYVVALLVTYTNVPSEISFLAAPVGAALLATVVGAICLRLSGVYFAMLTLAFSQLLWALVFQWGELTGGDDGLIGIWPPDWVGTRQAVFYAVLVTTVIALGFLRRFAFSPFGYSLRAARDNPIQAEAMGINVKAIQLLAFVLAGAMAGLAGALFVFAKGSVFPTEMDLARSFDALIAVLLGGIKTISGGIVGGAAFKGLEDFSVRFDYWRLQLGLLIIAVVIAAPEGILGTIRRLTSHFASQAGR